MQGQTIFDKLYKAKRANLKIKIDKQDNMISSKNRTKPKGNEASLNPKWSSQKLKLIESVLIPNHILKIKIRVEGIEPYVIDYENKPPVSALEQKSLFPNKFKLHIHHFENHLISQLNFSSSISSRKQIVYPNDSNIMGKIFHNHQSSQDTIKSKGEQVCQGSSLNLQIQYIFREHNIDMYTNITLADKQYSNIVIGIQDSNTSLVYGLGKINFFQYIVKDVQANLSSGIAQFQKKLTVKVKKMISFDRIIPLEQMPQMCSLKIVLNVSLKPVVPLFNLSGKKIVQQKSSEPDKNQKGRQLKRSLLNKTLMRSPERRNLSNSVDKSSYRSHVNSYTQKSPLKLNPKSKIWLQSPTLQQHFPQKQMFYYDIFQQQTFYINFLSKFNRFFQKKEKNTKFIFRNKTAKLIQELIKQFQNEKQNFSNSINIKQYQNINIGNCILKLELINLFNEEQENQNFKLYELRLKVNLSIKESNYFQKVLKDSENYKKTQITFDFQQNFLKKLFSIIIQQYSNNQQESLKFPSFKLKIRPNHLFGICKLKNNQLISKSKNQKQNYLNDPFQNKNMLLRLSSNLYVYKTSIFSNNLLVSKNNILQKVTPNNICSYFLKPNFQLSNHDQIHQIQVFPIGTPFKVITDKNHGSFTINFQAQPHQQYRYFQSFVPNNFLHNAFEGNISNQKISSYPYSKTNKIKIQMAVGLGFLSKGKQTADEKLLSYFQQIQYFDCELCFDKESSKSSPYRQIQIKKSNCFHKKIVSLQMMGLVPDNQQLYISSSNSAVLTVVNGQKFSCKNEQSKLYMQIHRQISPGYFNGESLQLIINDWIKGQTFEIHLYLINRDQEIKQPIITSSEKQNASDKKQSLKMKSSEKKLTFRLA